MFKLMKYEIRGTYKFVLATILVVALAIAGVQYTVYNLSTGFNADGSSMLLLQMLIPLLSILIIAASIAFIVYLIQSFRKELYEDRGYLTFTLPLSGKEILGAKLIVAMLWSILFTIVLIGVNILVFGSMFDGYILRQIGTELGMIIERIGGGIVSGAFLYFSISSIVSLLTVYLAITLSKVAIKNRTIGGLWILIFLGLQIVFSFIETRIINLFPLYTDMGSGFSSSSTNNLMNIEFGFALDMTSGSPVFSVSALIYWLILGIGIFLFTSHLLDRKIEL